MADEPSNLPALPPVAPSLDQARRGQLVYVDNKGMVKAPSSMNSRKWGIYAVTGVVTTAGVAFAWTVLPAAIPIYLLLGGRFVTSVNAIGRLNDASIALSAGDPARAKELAEPVRRAWYLPKRLRALAAMRVAGADATRGDKESALKMLREARQALPIRTIQHQMSYYFEINLLAAMGRVKDARAVLVGRGKKPVGEVLLLSHWLAELHVCCAEGKHEFDEAEILERAKKGLAMSAGGDLLMLCAWAADQLGNRDQKVFFLHEARQRDRTSRLEETMPALAKWYEAQAVETPSVDFLVE